MVWHPVVSLPNAISAARLVLALLLPPLAMAGQGDAVLALFGCLCVSDVADGLLARALNRRTELGARLDSWADATTYSVMLFCAWILWPQIVRREMPYLGTAFVTFMLPGVAGLLKFGQLPGYHTWSAKLASASMGVSTLLLFTGLAAVPFRMAVGFLVLASVEETAMTLVLPAPRADVSSILGAVRDRRCRPRGDGNAKKNRQVAEP